VPNSGQTQEFEALRENDPEGDLAPKGKVTFYQKPSAFTVLGTVDQTGLKIHLSHECSWD
jgi:hypothetical protein